MAAVGIAPREAGLALAESDWERPERGRLGINPPGSLWLMPNDAGPTEVEARQTALIFANLWRRRALTASHSRAACADH